MSWRVVVVTKSAKLEYSMEYLVVRDAESTTKVHLGDISVLLIRLCDHHRFDESAAAA